MIFPCIFPNNRENHAETGSHKTASTAICIYNLLFLLYLNIWWKIVTLNSLGHRRYLLFCRFPFLMVGLSINLFCYSMGIISAPIWQAWKCRCGMFRSAKLACQDRPPFLSFDLPPFGTVRLSSYRFTLPCPSFLIFRNLASSNSLI
jgi:hypothetical protein